MAASASSPRARADERTWCWGARDVVDSLAPGGVRRETQRVPYEVPGGVRLTALAAGGTQSCGLDAEGAAWCWGGDNSHAERGTPELGVVDRPTRVMGSHRFRAITAGSIHTCALDTEGKAYCWGFIGPQLGRG